MRTIGYVEFLAAEVLDGLVQAGLATDGRQLELVSVSTGGLQRTFANSAEAADAMTRRANDLRRKARLFGGTYNPSILRGEKGPPGEPGPKGPPGDQGPQGLPAQPAAPIEWKYEVQRNTVGDNFLDFPDVTDDTVIIIEGNKLVGSEPTVRVGVSTWVGRWRDIEKSNNENNRYPILNNNQINFGNFGLGNIIFGRVISDSDWQNSNFDYTQLWIRNVSSDVVASIGIFQASVGPKGDKGDKGDRGDDGPAGTSPTIDNVYPILKETVKAGAGATLLADDDEDELIFTVNKQPGRWIFAATKQWTTTDLTETLTFDTNIPAAATDTNLNIFKLFYAPVDGPTGAKYESIEFRFNTIPTTYNAVTSRLVIVGAASRIVYCWKTTYTDDDGNSMARLNIRRDTGDTSPFISVFYIYAPTDTDLPSGGAQPTPGTTLTFEDEGSAITGTFSKVNFKGTAIQAAADPQDASTLDVTVTATGSGGGGTGEGDISDEEFAAFMDLTLFGPPTTVNWKTSVVTTGDAVVSTDNTATFGATDFIALKLGSAGAAQTIQSNLIAKDGIWVGVRKYISGASTTMPAADYWRFIVSGGQSNAGNTTPWVYSATTGLGQTVMQVWFNSQSEANSSPYRTYTTGDVFTFTVTGPATIPTLNQTTRFTTSGTGTTLTPVQVTTGGFSMWKVEIPGTWDSNRGSVLAPAGYGGFSGSNPGAAPHPRVSVAKAAPGSYSTTEYAGQILAPIAGADIVETDVLRVWVQDETWTQGVDQYDDFTQTGPGFVRFYRNIATRAGQELPGVPASIFGLNATGRLGNIPTDDLAAHIIGPTGRRFKLTGTWTLTSNGALPSAARQIGIGTTGGNQRQFNVTGTATASDRVNQHLQAFVSSGYNFTLRRSNTDTGGWRFKVGGSINVNTIANGGFGFTALTISGTPPTGAGTYHLIVDGDIVHWAELFSEGLKPAIQAGDGISVTADDAAETLTIAATGSGGLSAATQAQADALTLNTVAITPGRLKEAVYEAMKAIVADGTGITTTDSDSAHTISFAAAASGGGGPYQGGGPGHHQSQQQQPYHPACGQCDQPDQGLPGLCADV